MAGRAVSERSVDRTPWQGDRTACPGTRGGGPRKGGCQGSGETGPKEAKGRGSSGAGGGARGWGQAGAEREAEPGTA